MAEQLSLALPVLSDYGEDAFLIAASNRQAADWIDRWPDWPQHRLLLWGPPGSGKTHLGRIWARRAGAFTLAAAALAGEGPVAAFEAGAGGAWLVEDLHRLQDEEALLYLINAAAQCGSSLLLTADRPPARLGLKLPALSSRLATVSLAELEAPEEELLGGVLWKLFADRQLRVPAQLVRYLLPRMGRSLEEAVRLVAALDAAALERGREITLPLAREVLRDWSARREEVEEDGRPENRPQTAERG